MRSRLTRDNDIVCKFPRCGCTITWTGWSRWEKHRHTHCVNHAPLDRRAEVPSMMARAEKMRDALLAQRK